MEEAGKALRRRRPAPWGLLSRSSGVGRVKCDGPLPPSSMTPDEQDGSPSTPSSPSSRRRKPGPEGVARPSHRTAKLIPGGTEEGHPLTPAELRKARASSEKFEVTYAPSPLGVPTWTIGSGSGQHYRVLVPAFPDREGAQCSCLDFLTRGLGTCKHLEATLAQAAISPPPGLERERAKLELVAPGWAQIERAQEEALALLKGPSPPGPAVLAVALRRVGRFLTGAD